jgi:4-diphosphocytidyl-2-C-methyl-D-erythritol kinase
MKSLLDLPAPAKLNLFLHVTGRRADGYHLLQSLFVPIDWCDRLHIERRDDGALTREDLGPPLPADDLCLRAARALQQAAGVRAGAHIAIEKHVPWGAGLGGGSSDAATTLLALNRLWGLNWPRSRLMALGLTLGADVPFFLGPGPAFVQGIGEQLTPLPVPAAEYLVVKPEAAIATRDIFTHPLLRRDSQALSLTEAAILAGSPEISAGGLGNTGTGIGALLDRGFGRNDLQAPAEQVCPEVAEAARWLGTRFGNSRMSGSGSAVFARLDGGRDERKDQMIGTAGPPEAMPVPQALQELQRTRPRWVARHCRSLEQHPLAAWAAEGG